MDRREVVRRLYEIASNPGGVISLGPWGDELSALLERAAELLQDNDEAVTAFRTETSFPFLKIAREHRYPYRDVLMHAESIYNPDPAAPLPLFTLGGDIDLAIERAVLDEATRRREVQA